MNHYAPGKAQGLKLLFKLHNQKLESKKTKKQHLLLDKIDWYKVFSLPVIKPTVGGREDPTIYVVVITDVFHNIDMIVVKSIVVDVKWRSARISMSMTNSPVSL